VGEVAGQPIDGLARWSQANPGALTGFDDESGKGAAPGCPAPSSDTPRTGPSQLMPSTGTAQCPPSPYGACVMRNASLCPGGCWVKVTLMAIGPG